MVTKSRTFYTSAVAGVSRPTHFNQFEPYSYSGILNQETIMSNSHWRVSSGWSGGGPMFLTRNTTSFNPDVVNTSWPQPGGYLGNGSVRLMYPAQSVPNSLGIPQHPSQLSRYVDGTQAIARTEPTNPAFDLSVFIGELRAEGIPNLPGTALREKVKSAKSGGSEYLNVEFGWLPLIRGVRDFCKTVNNADKIITSYQQKANQVWQRRYEWPAVEQKQAFASRFSAEPAVGFFEGGGVLEHRFERKWFEAEYEYYLPTGPKLNEKLQRYGSYARKLLGLDLSPEVLWNLSPWSWAADWFANTGDVMHNISALGTDGMVIRHAYVMHHTGLTRQSTGDLFGIPSLRQSRLEVTETKSRLGASPFGFGLVDADLSAKQKAIIAALGLTKTR